MINKLYYYILYIVTEVTHENRTETRDESPIEMIDSSDPESSEESEINVCCIMILIYYIHLCFLSII